MSSLPPMGGTPRRSRLVAWPAPIASFPSSRTVARARSAGRNTALSGNPLSSPHLMDQLADRIHSSGEPENRALAAPSKPMAA